MKTTVDVNPYPVDFRAAKRYYVRRANGMEPGNANAKENANA